MTDIEILREICGKQFYVVVPHTHVSTLKDSLKDIAQFNPPPNKQNRTLEVTISDSIRIKDITGIEFDINPNTEILNFDSFNTALSSSYREQLQYFYFDGEVNVSRTIEAILLGKLLGGLASKGYYKIWVGRESELLISCTKVQSNNTILEAIYNMLSVEDILHEVYCKYVLEEL